MPMSREIKMRLRAVLDMGSITLLQ
jgi:hypothetical protein